MNHKRSGRGAIASPNLDAVHSVVGSKVQSAIDVCEMLRIGAVASADIHYEHGSCCGAIGFPKFDAVDPIIAGKIQSSADISQRACTDGPHYPGSRSSAITLPKFIALSEEKCAVNVSERRWVCAARKGDVRHHHGSGSSSIAFPKGVTTAIIGREEK